MPSRSQRLSLPPLGPGQGVEDQNRSILNPSNSTRFSNGSLLLASSNGNDRLNRPDVQLRRATFSDFSASPALFEAPPRGYRPSLLERREIQRAANDHVESIEMQPIGHITTEAQQGFDTESATPGRFKRIIERISKVRFFIMAKSER